MAPRLVEALSDLFPDSTHVRRLGMAEASDREIWVHARDSGFAIVSKDNDFQQMSFVFGAPPKVIWIRRGNCSVAEIEEVLRTNAVEVPQYRGHRESRILDQPKEVS